MAQFHWQQICRACEELQIHCAPCSSSQLGALKAAGVLPVAAHQCGLITKSDAERLTSYLMIQNSQVGASCEGLTILNTASWTENLVLRSEFNELK